MAISTKQRQALEQVAADIPRAKPIDTAKQADIKRWEERIGKWQVETDAKKLEAEIAEADKEFPKLIEILKPDLAVDKLKKDWALVKAIPKVEVTSAPKVVYEGLVKFQEAVDRAKTPTLSGQKWRWGKWHSDFKEDVKKLVADPVLVNITEYLKKLEADANFHKFLAACSAEDRKELQNTIAALKSALDNEYKAQLDAKVAEAEKNASLKGGDKLTGSLAEFVHEQHPEMKAQSVDASGALLPDASGKVAFAQDKIKLTVSNNKGDHAIECQSNDPETIRKAAKLLYEVGHRQVEITADEGDLAEIEQICKDVGLQVVNKKAFPKPKEEKAEKSEDSKEEENNNSAVSSPSAKASSASLK